MKLRTDMAKLRDDWKWRYLRLAVALGMFLIALALSGVLPEWWRLVWIASSVINLVVTMVYLTVAGFVVIVGGHEEE